MKTSRLPKFRRVPESVAGKGVTDRGIQIIRIISRYRLISTGTLVGVVGANADVTYRHLHRLYHQGFISRFTLPRRGNPGQFIYFLENAALLRTIAHRLPPDELDWSQIKRNREKFGDIIPAAEDRFGKFLFVRHELMISDFHAALELACRASLGRVELDRWRQGTELHSRVRMPNKKTLPHRPDAFFTLRFPLAPEGQQRSNFFYEADRDTSNVTRLREKLEVHVEYLKQGKQTMLSIKRIRAVLVETISEKRLNECMAVTTAISQVDPVARAVFWISSVQTSEPAFAPRWLTAADETLRSLVD